MRQFLTILALSILPQIHAQQGEALTSGVAESVSAEIQSVPLNLVNQSWFIDRPGLAVVYFDNVVDEVDEIPRGVKGLTFLDVEVQATPGSKKGKSMATLRFALRQTGLVTIPAIDFTAGDRTYRSIPEQILVGEAVPTEAMAVSLTPQKQRIYVGEPLRLDFTWRCDFEAGRVQALNYYPAFFNDAAVEVVIPRNTSEDSQQVGLPLGGRRVIANRTVSPVDGKALGTIELPLYLRWSEEGTYVIPASRVECVRLIDSSRNFGQYAAHFNNELFAAEDARVRYERFYVETAPIEITVLPLPEEGRLPGFSGWFAPIRVDVSVKDTELKLGQLMEVELKIVSSAPHGMIELPYLSRQRSLRGRFLVDDQLGRFWRADGTTYKARVRVLSSSVTAFPSLRFQSFNPESARYEILTTEPVPISVHAGDGTGLIDISAYAGAQVSLVPQQAGVWHNLEDNVMDDLMNTPVVQLADWFWLLILMGPLTFILLLPQVRERRRRATDSDYRERVAAYQAFKRCADNGQEKWHALLRLMAVSFQTNATAWTVGDSRRALESIGASDQDIEQVVALHASQDDQEFSPKNPTMPSVDFSGIGQRIFRLINKSALIVLFLISLGFSSDLDASEWSAAEALFDQAMTAQAGSDEAVSLFSESAFKFQAVAETGERPGIAWYNAGNAWFQTGALGRSIAAYREAQIFRPFDALIRDNLNAARQLTLTDVPQSASAWPIPAICLKAALVLVSLSFWILLLLLLRYRTRFLLVASLALGLSGFLLAVSLLWQQTQSVRQGVVIVGEVVARKGPGYAYAQAFDQALQDGLEFQLIEARADWVFIQFTDGRQCWIPGSQVQFISN